VSSTAPGEATAPAEVAVRPGCQDDYDPASLSVTQARARIAEAVTPVRAVETVPLRAALGRILAGELHSPMDVPGGVNSAMDGYALHSRDLPGTGSRSLSLVGSAFAGRPHLQPVPAGACVRIMTGALLPPGTDTVVAQERAEAGADGVRIGTHTAAGENVRQAGEDVARGARVLDAGRQLTPADLGLIASLGLAEVTVVRRLRVAFFSTGDELCRLGEPLQAGQIYDSNRHVLFGLLQQPWLESSDHGIVRDERVALEQALRAAAAGSDLVLTSGGVSVGEADLVRETLAALGSIRFWKVAMKPGRPLAFGHLGDACFFGLPGNPVSVMVTFHQFVLPLLYRLAGRGRQEEPLRFTVPCISRLRKRPGRMEYQRGILHYDADGRLVVARTGAQGSGILTSMSRANCYIVLPVESATVEPGSPVEVQQLP